MKLVVAFCLLTSLLSFGQKQTNNVEQLPSADGVQGCDAFYWCWEHDPSTPGISVGTSQMSGTLRRFDAVWKYYGGQRFHVYLGNDAASTGFTLDTWIYFNQLATVDNIELDLNQVAPNGATVIFGLQCNFPRGMWQYTTNRGGNTYWNDSNVACSRNVWTGGVWHHVILKYYRDAAGNVTYDSVNLDTRVSKFVGAGGPSAFYLGWQIGQQVANFQIDGNGTFSGTTAFMDAFTVTGQ
jgi:hypothetical protein